MANSRSARKRIRVSAKKTLQNKMIKSRTKTAIKKLIVLVNSGDKAAASAEYPITMKYIDMAATKGILHKNNAARKKSRLAKAINKMA